MKWTKEEENKLREYWALGSKEKLLNLFPNRTYSQIKDKALKGLRIKKLKKTNAKWNVDKLNSFDTEACYWWGIIMADGCLTRTQLILSLEQKDREHLQKFSDYTGMQMQYIERKNDYNPIVPQRMWRVAMTSKYQLSIWNKMFSISGRKTYNPPDLSLFNKDREKFRAFIVGFIDGDGSISFSNKRGYMGITCHSSWEKIFNDFQKYLLEYFGIKSTITRPKEGLISIRISSHSHLLKLLEISKGLPVLDRKWEKIKIIENEKKLNNFM